MEPYKYSRLDRQREEIRLFSIDKEDGLEGQFRLRLAHHNFPTAPRYCTLSYTWDAPCTGLGPEWDDPTFKIPVAINGLHFEVRKNLHAALAELMRFGEAVNKSEGETLFWVDAICINQDDDDERSDEVLRMGQIYKSSVHTLIWLGPLDFDSLSPLRQVRMPPAGLSPVEIDLWTRGEQAISNMNITRTRTADCEPWNPKDEISSALLIQEWEHAENLLNRAWFNRVWTVQELVVSSSIFVSTGRFICSWGQLLQVPTLETRRLVEYVSVHNTTRNTAKLDIILSMAYRISWKYGFLCILRRTYGVDQGLSLKLTDILPLLRDRRCKNPRDKVYAALGMLNHYNLIAPDYSRSVAQVYGEAARHALMSSMDLAILAHASPFSPQGLPSWVPDWTHGSSILPRPLKRFAFKKEDKHTEPKHKLYNASIYSDFDFCVSEDLTTLAVGGVFVDSIHHVSKRPHKSRVNQSNFAMMPLEDVASRVKSDSEDEQAQWKDFRYLTEWFATLDMENLPKAINGNPFDVRYDPGADAFQFARFGYLPTRQSLAWAFLSSLSANTYYDRDGRTQGDLRQCIDSEGNVLQDGPDLVRSIRENLTNRTFIASNHGLIGIGPWYAQAGDLIFVAKGNDIPWLVRHKTEDQFTFVGEWYVHGVMHGEVFVDRPTPASKIHLV